MIRESEIVTAYYLFTFAGYMLGVFTMLILGYHSRRDE